MKKIFCLVYQAGIANVFVSKDTKKRKWTREMQSDFQMCENFCRGAKVAGAKIMVAWCNEAGDILNSHWNFSNFENAPFSDKFNLKIANVNTETNFQ